MARPKKNADGATKTKAPKAIASTQSLSSFVKSICDVMRRSNCASALQYVPELLIRPNEVLSGIAHARVLKVADHTLRIVVQHPHMRTGCLA